MAKPDDFTLLIVDDERELRLLLADRLKRDGFNTAEASCGKEAIEILKSQKIDLIISDVRMPSGDGLSIVDFVQALRKQTNAHSPKIILVTGYCDVSEAEAIERGAAKMMEKPVDRNNLIFHINDQLGISQ